MRRFLLFLSVITGVLAVLLVGSGVFTGHVIPPARTAVFVVNEPDAGWHTALVDTRVGTIIPRFTDKTNYPSAIDAQCHIQYAQVYAKDYGLAYIDALTGEYHTYRAEYERQQGFVDALPDKRRLWVEYGDLGRQTTVEIFDTASGEAVPVALPPDAALYGPVWSPDSTHGIVYRLNSRPMTGYLVEAATGALTPLQHVLYPDGAWSPDSRYFASMSNEHSDYQLAILDSVTLAETTFLMRQVGTTPGITWTPDNRLLFFARNDETSGGMYAWTPGSAAPHLTHLSLDWTYLYNSIRANAWSPDAAKFFYETPGGTVLMDARTGVQLAMMPHYADLPYLTYTWSPDGRYLVAYDFDSLQALVVTDSVTGQTTHLSINPNSLAAVRFVPRWLSDTELEMFQRSTSTLGRIVLHEGTAEFVADYQLSGAYRAAYCNPETAA